MSGPKTSRYTLTPEQRRILLEQQERERRIKEEIARIKRYINELNIICNNFDEPLSKARELNNRANNKKLFIDLVTELRKQIQVEIERNNETSGELDFLINRRKSLETCYKKVKIQITALNDEAIEIDQQLNNINTMNIEKGFLISFNKPVNHKQVSRIAELSNMLENRLHKLQKHNLSDELMQEVISSIERMREITSIDFLENFEALTICPLEKRCKKYIDYYNGNIDQFNVLITRYQVLCEKLYISPKEFIFSTTVIPDLEKEIAAMEKQLVCQTEEAYISDTIDFVMKEMGYTLLGDRTVVKKNGKRLKSELYYFDEGTAVDITYSSDGKITMELGALDSVDRLPTLEETTKLCSEMQEFCDDFSVIEKELAARGVVLSERVSIMPPAPDHAQIINSSEFRMITDINKFSFDNQIYKGRKQKIKRMEL